MENDMRTFKCCTDQFGFVRTLNLIGAALHSLIHAVSDDFDISEQGADAWARAFYADADPEIRAVLEAKE